MKKTIKAEEMFDAVNQSSYLGAWLGLKPAGE